MASKDVVPPESGPPDVARTSPVVGLAPRPPLGDDELDELREVCLSLATDETEAEEIMAETVERAYGEDAPELLSGGGAERSLLRLIVIARIVATERRSSTGGSELSDGAGDPVLAGDGEPVLRGGGDDVTWDVDEGQEGDGIGEADGIEETDDEWSPADTSFDPQRRRASQVFRAVGISSDEAEHVAGEVLSPRERTFSTDLPMVLTATVARLMAGRSIPRRLRDRLRSIRAEREQRVPVLVGSAAVVAIVGGGLMVALLPSWGSSSGSAPERILTSPAASGGGEPTTTTSPTPGPSPSTTALGAGLLSNPEFIAFLDGLQASHHTPFGASLFAALPALFHLPPVPPSPPGALPPPGPSLNPPPNPPVSSGPPPTSPPPPPPPPTTSPPPPPPPPTTTTTAPKPPPTTTTTAPKPPPTTTTTAPKPPPTTTTLPRVTIP